MLNSVEHERSVITSGPELEMKTRTADHEKTNHVVSEQVRHKPVREDS